MGVKRLLDGGLSLDPEVASEVLGTNFTPQDPGHHIARTNNTWHVAGVVGPQTLRCGAEVVNEAVKEVSGQACPRGLSTTSPLLPRLLQQPDEPLGIACLITGMRGSVGLLVNRFL